MLPALCLHPRAKREGHNGWTLLCGIGIARRGNGMGHFWAQLYSGINMRAKATGLQKEGFLRQCLIQTWQGGSKAYVAA